MRYILTGLILLVVISCTSPKKVLTEIPANAYQELMRYNERWQKAIRTLEGQARITLDTPMFSGNFTSEILKRGADSLLVGVKGPFGISLARIFLSGNRFVLHNQFTNQFITGSAAQFNGDNFMQFPIKITELSKVFTAQDRFEILKKEKFEIRDQQYYLEATNARLKYHIWFDPENSHIKKIEYFNGDSLLFYKEYDRFETINEISFPKVINFVRPSSRQGMSIIFEDLKINQAIDSSRFLIRISDNVKQIDFSLDHKTE
jgi:hypothetical protein